MMKCEVPLLFLDKKEPFVLTNKEIVKAIPILVKSMECLGDDWETKDTVLSDSIEIKFPQWAGEFLFDHILQYSMPTGNEKPTVENFADANAKTLDELKVILELSNFFQCTEFMSCISFVVAKKLEVTSMEEISKFFGMPLDKDGKYFTEADGWIHPPLVVFQGENKP
ncbi:unnamed protein product [Caenorhabditis nigoni]|uniref:SKP1 component dimerisation domain-containing protein n=1 Tax=Caenorhabditis nigoni TaxID=1611254 RepID=A0A2G5U2D7_9PELO|nr:hypothetical protein B9Z55_013582 [Caenorhabditis nigoni]